MNTEVATLRGWVSEFERQDWSVLLQGFTNRNAGRWTILEIDDPGLGAQRLVEGRLWGVAYDRPDDQIDLLFGDFEGGRDHLTHTVGHPESMDFLRDGEGRDVALRIAHEGGQTLLLVLPRRRRE